MPKVCGEKIKVLRALKGFDDANINSETVRAQYNAGHLEGHRVPGYVDGLPEALKNSRTETYAAIKTEIANWRWAGVPFYLRTGKRMAKRRSEIVIQFKSTPHNLFGDGHNQPNQLVLRLQPTKACSFTCRSRSRGPAI